MIAALLLAGTLAYPLADTNTTATLIHLTGRTWQTNLVAREALWGLGERFDAWNQRGQVVECWARDMAQGGPSSSYFAVPFVVSSEGWGLFVNCAGKVRFDCRGNEVRVEVPEDGVEAFLFKGAPREILADYTKLVGRPAVPPAWVFEPWVSRNSYLGASEIDHVVDKMEQNGMKPGVVVLEAWAEGLQNFKFEERRYPNPKEWISRLHERGVHVVCWETPSIWTSASTYPEAKTKGFLVLNADGSEYVTDWLENGRKIDFRKPEARAWWTKLHEPLVAIGVDGFKTDGGERMPDPAFHNLQPSYYQHAVPAITFARSANPACNGLFWAGDQNADWNSLRRVVRAGLSAAMSGFPFWGHDIGGYTGTPTKKLYVRWLELGALSPIMQLHGITPREPWYYDGETMRIAKRYFELRADLKAYLLATARQEGSPMWRPLAWAFPDDVRVREIDDEFMLGDDLLVAPILNEFDERTIYLPAGEWIDVWTKDRHTGPKSWQAKVDLATIPVFVLAGTSNAPAFTPLPAPGDTELELAGATNTRGVVPVQRVFRGQSYEKIFLTVRNRTSHDLTGAIACRVPDEVSLLPGTNQLITVSAGQEARVAFYASLAGDAPVGSYPIEARATLSEGTVSPVKVILVKLPSWRVGIGGEPAKIQWRDVSADAVAQDGYLDAAKILGESPRRCFGTTSIISPRQERARLWVGTGDSVTLWLNGEKVLERIAHRGAEPDEEMVAVSLREGTNLLLLRLDRDLGPCGWYLRLENER